MPRYKITFRSRKQLFRREEARSEIIEAPNLEEAEQMAHREAQRYPVDWAVSVEELKE